MTIAFELQDGVYHMLKYFWTGNGAVFGDMPDQKYGNVCLFGKAQQVCGAFAYLNYRTWRAFYSVCVEGLDRVDDEQLWLNGLSLHQNLLQIGFGE